MSRAGKTRNPWAVWVLSFVTLGVCWCIWYYKINRELREFDGRISVQPGTAVVAVTLGAALIGIPPLVSVIKTGGRIAHAEQLAGVKERASGLLYLLANLVFGLGVVYYQKHLNSVWAAFGSPAEGAQLAR